ncbi:hypothetical protein ZYGR_0K00110 [Zygosaccharomyces rouxii]|uniref:Protein YIF1 n=1 Tax=Zygosaccharomyces rouxii TaxID=4956 RepID=A0A1Q2ZYH8_ZYGRO|nr:hypothetical protein ZYGR_0K00110 [Zygosaccharomyces rouxii]
MSYNPYSYSAQGTMNDRSRDAYMGGPNGGVQPGVQNITPGQAYPADPSTSMAYQLGQTAFTNFIGQQNFSQFQEVSKATSSSLSHYFQVTTAYVLRKLKIILLPFYNKSSWQRLPGSQMQ